jgi:flavodoxin
MKRIITLLLAALFICCSDDNRVFAESAQNRTLVAYYSYTGNVQSIVDELKGLTNADIVEIQPAKEGERYEADNYAIGSALISAIRENPDKAESYPEIKPLNVDFGLYDNIIVATPLWWSNMAAPMQTFLFANGAEMAGKNIALIVSSASSGISSVVADAKRLIPDGVFGSDNLWINNSNRSQMSSLLADWAAALNFTNNMSEKLYITIGSTTLTATLVDNSSARALVAALKEAPITYEAHDYGNFEKVGDLGRSFPTNDEQITTQPGDLILYQGNNLCIYHDVNTWNFTRLGKIDNATQAELKAALGEGNCTITLSLSAGNNSENQNNNETPTGIRQSDRTATPDEPMYDLQGRRISAPVRGQIYIQGGEKRMNYN